jgi:hypothetical protein
MKRTKEDSMKTKSKLLLAALLVIALVQLSCSREDLPLLPNETGYERLQAECEAAGGTWRVEIVDDDLERWCEYPPASGDPAQGSNGQDPAGGDNPNPTNTPDLTGVEGSLEDCDATSLLGMNVPDLGWEVNDCACNYHYTLRNKHTFYAVIVFSHMTVRMSPDSGGSDDFWLRYIFDGIPPGETIADGGSGWIVEAWGGFYSTCQLEDGEYSAPEYFYMDKIFARLAAPGCAWIDEPAEYESRALTLSNNCNP